MFHWVYGGKRSPGSDIHVQETTEKEPKGRQRALGAARIQLQTWVVEARLFSNQDEEVFSAPSFLRGLTDFLLTGSDVSDVSFTILPTLDKGITSQGCCCLGHSSWSSASNSNCLPGKTLAQPAGCKPLGSEPVEKMCRCAAKTNC